MEFDNEPTDEQLDEMLRRVVTPLDLKSQLKQIPVQTETDAPSIADVSIRESTTSIISWATLILAASLLGIGLFIASRFLPESTNGHVPVGEMVQNDLEVKTGIQPPESDLATGTSVEFLLAREELEAEIHAIKIAQLNAQLIKMQTAAIQIDQREVESMIAAMTEEYAIPFDAPETQVKSRMAQVIKRYPGTRGAEMAQEFLNQANN